MKAAERSGLSHGVAVKSCGAAVNRRERLVNRNRRLLVKATRGCGERSFASVKVAERRFKSDEVATLHSKH